MRQKKIKQATIENLNKWNVMTEVRALNIEKTQKVFVEIGSGKGRFVTSLAKDFPQDIFIAIEKDLNAAYRLAEKQEILKLPNLLIICGDAKDLMVYFESVKVDGLYLNFSDPWPKSKHHKRRLTYPTFLKMYREILRDDGILQFRTDHESLFLDSLVYFQNQFKATDISYDLAESNYMTEYEVKKRLLGKIFQFKGVKI